MGRHFLLQGIFSSPSCLPFTTAASRTTTKHSGLNLIETEVEIGCVGVCVCMCVCVLAMPFCSSQIFHDFLLLSG